MPKRLPDPRVVIALVAVLSVYGVTAKSEKLLALLLVLSLTCAVAVGVPLGRLFGSLKRIWQASLAIALAHSLFAPVGETILSVGGIALLTTGGLVKGLMLIIRLALFIVGGAMISVYPQRTLIEAMVRLRLPYDAAYMVSVGLRFVPLIGEELRDSLIALQLRGVVIEELRMGRRLSLYSYLLLPSVASSLQNARELAMSMEMRAFRAMRERTSYHALSLDKRDTLLLCMVFVLAAALAVVTLCLPAL